MTRFVRMAALSLAVAGCTVGGEPPADGSARPTAPGTAASSTARASASATTTASAIATSATATLQLLTCSTDIVFPAAALGGPLEPNGARDEPAGTFRGFLASPPPDYSWPPDGWRRLLDDDRRVLFAAANPKGWEDNSGGPGNIAFVDVASVGGAWTVTAYGECWPRVVLEGGLQGGSWEVALVSDDTKRLELLVTQFACSGGQAAGERVQPPTVVETDLAVTITFGIKPLSGDQDCPTSPATPYGVELREPIGQRVLQDGIFFPPRVVEKP